MPWGSEPESAREGWKSIIVQKTPAEKAAIKLPELAQNFRLLTSWLEKTNILAS
jgi:hypothetical protein